MPIILPTVDELARMDWHGRQRAIARASRVLRSLLEVPEGDQPTRVLWDSSHESWAETTRMEAARLQAAMPVDPDHGPMGNPEAEKNIEIRLLRAEVRRLAKENETLKVKLSRMCCDA